MTALITAGRHRCRIKSVHDADTNRADIFLKSSVEHLGFGVELTTKVVLRDWSIRYCDINALELSEDGGKEARDWVANKILGKMVTCQFHLVNGDEEKQGKYGRWVAEVIYKGESINFQLVEQGHAVVEKY